MYIFKLLFQCIDIVSRSYLNHRIPKFILKKLFFLLYNIYLYKEFSDCYSLNVLDHTVFIKVLCEFLLLIRYAIYNTHYTCTYESTTEAQKQLCKNLNLYIPGILVVNFSPCLLSIYLGFTNCTFLCYLKIFI